jgi:hypothetical protein
MKITVAYLRDLLDQYAKEEISFSRMVELLNERPLEDLRQANEMLRSLHSVVARRGADTNWKALEARLKEVLSEQRRLLYPETACVSPHSNSPTIVRYVAQEPDKGKPEPPGCHTSGTKL